MDDTHGMATDSGCCFCDYDELVSHLFFECMKINNIWKEIPDCLNITRCPMGLTKVTVKNCFYGNIYEIWKARNQMIFSQKNMKHRIKDVIIQNIKVRCNMHS